MSRRRLFTYRDVLRIVRAVEPGSAPGHAPTETMLILSCTFELLGDLIWSIGDFPGVQIEQAFLGKVAGRVASVLVELLSRSTWGVQSQVWRILTGTPAEGDLAPLTIHEEVANGSEGSA